MGCGCGGLGAAMLFVGVFLVHEATGADARLEVTSDAAATVYVDGAPEGPAPVSVVVEPGPHRVRLVGEDGREITRDVSLDRADTVRLSETFGPAPPAGEEAPVMQEAAAEPEAVRATPAREDVLSAMRAVEGEIAACARRGTANVRFEFASSGEVERVRVSGAGGEVARCVEEAATAAVVPPFRNPSFSINYPFRLTGATRRKAARR